MLPTSLSSCLTSTDPRLRATAFSASANAAPRGCFEHLLFHTPLPPVHGSPVHSPPWVSSLSGKLAMFPELDPQPLVSPSRSGLGVGNISRVWSHLRSSTPVVTGPGCVRGPYLQKGSEHKMHQTGSTLLKISCFPRVFF